MKLALRPRAVLPDDHPLAKFNPVQYEVLGLPPNLEVWIGGLDHRMKTGRWRILRIFVQDNGAGMKDVWTGDYDSPEAALAALEAELGSE